MYIRMFGSLGVEEDLDCSKDDCDEAQDYDAHMSLFVISRMLDALWTHVHIECSASIDYFLNLITVPWSFRSF